MAARVAILALTLFVIGTGGAVEVLNAMTDRPIERTIEECADTVGNCKWRVEFGNHLENFTRQFAFFPGLLVYPLAPIAVLAAWHRGWSQGSRRSFWWTLAALSALVLARFMWLGVFTAATA